MRWIEMRQRVVRGLWRVARGFLGVAAPILVACVLLALLCVVIGSYLLSHPEVRVPAENRHHFARVGILVDGTRSTQPHQNYPLIKTIVQEKILPAVGSNDVVAAYDVWPDFKLQQNTVFGLEKGDQLPQDPDQRRAEILDVIERNRESKTPDPELYDLVHGLPRLRAREETIRSGWARRLAQRAEPSRSGSDICHPLAELARFLREGDPDAERWLFVLSDLQHTGPRCDSDSVFPDATIVLIVPPDPRAPSWQKLLRRWQDFFSGRRLERVSFTAALADPSLLPPNPTAGLERYQVRTQWECARPMIGPALLAAIGLGVVISAVAAWLRRPRRGGDPMGKGGALGSAARTDP
jgi:hypothetical protein